VKKYIRKVSSSVELNLFRVLFIVLFLFYYGGTTIFFTHTHYLDGREITHTHPYLPSDEHTHTATEFSIICSLSNFVFIIGFLAFTFIINISKIIYVHRNINLIIQKVIEHYDLRAPPFFFKLIISN